MNAQPKCPIHLSHPLGGPSRQKPDRFHILYVCFAMDCIYHTDKESTIVKQEGGRASLPPSDADGGLCS
jgi:hypothetical protein